jgi:hypothetical protein
MVDHKVRHLEQSFVALKFCVRIEWLSVLICASPLTPSANGTDYSAVVCPVNAFLSFVSVFRKNCGTTH